MLAQRAAREGQRQGHQRVRGEKTEDRERAQQVVHRGAGDAAQSHGRSGGEHQRGREHNGRARSSVPPVGALERGGQQPSCAMRISTRAAAVAQASTQANMLMNAPKSMATPSGETPAFAASRCSGLVDR